MWAPLFPGEPFDYGGSPIRAPEYIVALYDTLLSIEVKRASRVAIYAIIHKLGPFFCLHLRQRNKVSGEFEAIGKGTIIKYRNDKIFRSFPVLKWDSRGVSELSIYPPSFYVRLWRAAKRGGVTNESNVY